MFEQGAIQVDILQNPQSFDPWIRIYYKDHQGIWLAKPMKLEFELHRPHEPASPTLELPRHVLQQIVDAFVKAGMKPEVHSETLGKLQATENHLQDMRRISFKLLHMDHDGDGSPVAVKMMMGG